MKRVKFYCFGNPLVKKDSMPIILIPLLKKEFPDIEFIEAGSPEDIEGEMNLNIIDTAEGIENVKEIGIDEIGSHKCCSLHDFDLAMSLKLLGKMGKIKRLRIIGIPPAHSKGQAIKELKEMIRTFISS